MVEYMLWLQHRSLEVVMLKVWLHYGNPRVEKLEVRFQYRCLGGNQKVFQGGKASDGTSPWKFQDGRIHDGASP